MEYLRNKSKDFILVHLLNPCELTLQSLFNVGNNIVCIFDSN